MKTRRCKSELAFSVIGVFLCVFVACSDNSSGTFNLTFVWPEGQKPDFSKVSLYAWAKLQQWPGGDQAAATTLSEAGPAKLGDAAQELQFGDLTYGGERVVIVEIRGAERKDDAVLYFGASDLFSIEAGKTTEVAVKLALQPGPALEKPLVKILYQGVEKSVVPSASVTLRLTLSHADTVTVANDPAFSAGKVELPIASLKSLGGTEYEWPSAWDLNAGICGAQASGFRLQASAVATQTWGSGVQSAAHGLNQCIDGQRSVFVKGSNAFGYSSESAQATVTMDTTPPQVVAGTESVVLIPGVGNRLTSVSKITTGTTARVSFAVSEILASDPVVTIVPAGGTWTITKIPSGGMSYIYDAVLTGGTPQQGPHEFQVTLTDLAGHVTGPVALNLPAPGLEIDTVPPTQITAEQNDKILYTRIPWGSDATKGQKYYSVKTLDGQTDAVEPDATVIFWDDPDTTKANEIGRATADANGFFPETELNRADRAHVYMTLLDQSGNPDNAAATEIDNTEWVATMGYKVPGSTFENPHRFETRPWFAASLVQSGYLEQGVADGLDVTGGPILNMLGQGTWRKRIFKNPSARKELALTYDGRRGKAVLFGGWNGNYRDQETWEWDGVNWRNMQPTDPEGDGDPSARYGHALAYDGVRGAIVLFGGWDGWVDDETWEWDGVSWRKMTPADPEGDGNPAGRFWHSLSYDESLEKVVLFGGCAHVDEDLRCDDFEDEMWEWDGVSWRKSVPADPEMDGNPSARRGHAFACDSKRGKEVLYGGVDITGVYADTWEWNGASWMRMSPLDPEGDGNPSARSNHALAYDAAREKTVLFGGFGSSRLGDTWEWDGASWENKVPADPEGDGSPSARSSHAMAYDRSSAKVVLFGGYDGSYYDETWEWNGVSWRKTATTDPEGDGNPAMRWGPVLAYDKAKAESILFGGCVHVDPNVKCDDIGDDTWGWDGISWRNITPTDPEGDGNPSARDGHALAYDAARGKTVLFGGRDDGSSEVGDTWEWDGASWEKKVPADPEGDGSPSARNGHALAYDAAREKTVLFGGSSGSNETWEWDGASWEKKLQADPEGDGNPSARYWHAVVFDAAREKTVLFGGCTGTNERWFCSELSNETWEWDGARWEKKLPADPEGDGNPSVRWRHALTYDELRRKVILFGGYDALSRDDETWEWDGASWRRMIPADPEGDGNPSARERLGLAYDSMRGKGILFGGWDSNLDGETWEWDGGASARPGQTMQVTFSAANAPASSTLQSVSATFYAGGVGYPSGVETPGVDLKVWDEGMWKTVATNNSPPDNPQPVTWSTDTDPYWSNLKATDPAAFQNNIRRLFFGDQQTLNFAVTPAAPNGTGTGVVATDYVEVRVRYKQ